MRKRVFLFIIFIFVIFISTSTVSAACYEYCHNKSCQYDTSEFKCYHIINTKTGSDKYEVKKRNVSISNSSTKEVGEVSMDTCVANISNSSYQYTDNIRCSSSYNSENYVSCGGIGTFNKKIPEIVSWGFTTVEIIVPVILIILGVLDFIKALSSQKEDEIKKGQQMFIKRLIISVLIFFVVIIVKLLVQTISNSTNESNGIIECIDCFINNQCN